MGKSVGAEPEGPWLGDDTGGAAGTRLMGKSVGAEPEGPGLGDDTGGAA